MVSHLRRSRSRAERSSRWNLSLAKFAATDCWQMVVRLSHGGLSGISTIPTAVQRWMGVTHLNAKQWLSRARTIDREINELLKEKEEVRDRVLKITQSYTADTVQSSKDPHKFDRVVELEAEIDRNIDELVVVKTEINKGISQLTDGRYREILRLRYLQGMTFERIAVTMNYSWRHVCTLHGRALLKMEEIVNG